MNTLELLACVAAPLCGVVSGFWTGRQLRRRRARYVGLPTLPGYRHIASGACPTCGHDPYAIPSPARPPARVERHPPLQHPSMYQAESERRQRENRAKR